MTHKRPFTVTIHATLWFRVNPTYVDDMQVRRYGALWLSCAAALLLSTVAILSVWTGACTDYVTRPGTCAYEPAVGLRGAVVLSAPALAAAVTCVVKAVCVRPRQDNDERR